LSRAQKPYLNLFAKELFGKVEDLKEDEIELVVRLTKDVYEVVEREMGAKYYGETKATKLRFEMELQDILLSEEFCKVDKIVKNYKGLILQIVEIAEANKNDNKL
jgi:type I restriction enzyme R subunit